jgi:hypothetical protein
MDMIISSGYPNSYGSVADELAASKADAWFPTTVDFRATATHSGGAEEAASFDELLKVIGKTKKGSIEQLGLVGHANRETFALSGRVQNANVNFGKEGMLHPVSIKEKLEKIRAVRDRFTTDAVITLYACDAGVGTTLLAALSQAFQVTVQGFQNQIWWCFMVTAKGGAVRGRTWYDRMGAGLHPECGSSEFSADIRIWTPENKATP